MPTKKKENEVTLSPQLLEKLGEKNPDALVEVVMLSRKFSGPLPPPEIFEQYENTSPGAGKDIIEIAKEVLQIQRIEARGSARSKVLAALSSLLVPLALIGGGVYLASSGTPIYGVGFGLGGILLGIIGNLLRRNNKK